MKAPRYSEPAIISANKKMKPVPILESDIFTIEGVLIRFPKYIRCHSSNYLVNAWQVCFCRWLLDLLDGVHKLFNLSNQAANNTKLTLVFDQQNGRNVTDRAFMVALGIDEKWGMRRDIRQGVIDG